MEEEMPNLRPSFISIILPPPSLDTVTGYSTKSWNSLYFHLGQGEQFIPTGDKVIGLPVYDTPKSLEFQEQHQVVSTLPFLKKPDGSFVVYSLSVGP